MEAIQVKNKNKVRFALIVSRVASFLAFISLIAAWFSETTDNKLFGLSTQHFFNDAIVLSLWSIAGLLDGYLHSKNL
jgi:hypothetical protein